MASPSVGTPWEEMRFDYVLHHDHTQAMESKCELCHHIYDEEKKKLIYEKGKESSCRDCHGVDDEDNRRSFRKVSHAQCLDCHMRREKAGQSAGPHTCGGCHGETERPALEEMAKLPRLMQGQKDRILIRNQDGRMKAVPFDHKLHERQVSFCSDCHHRTHRPCSSCHTLAGSDEGAGISLETAFHDPDARISCVGCHEIQKQRSECMGCHRFQARGTTENACRVCHSGTWERPARDDVRRLLRDLPPERVPEKVEIKILQKDYQPAPLPHARIVEALIASTEKSTLANRFHADNPAICSGCHHRTVWDLEAKPPSCNSCHGTSRNPKVMERPGLMGAYHRQCMGCHQEMKIKALGCRDCHAEKPSAGESSGQAAN
jgi:hypothetical protein